MSRSILKERWLSPEELAELTGHSVNTLAHWRGAGKGPAYLKLSHRIAYSAADIEQWLESRRVETKTPEVAGYATQRKKRVLALSVQSAREALQRNNRLRGHREESQSR